MRLLTAREVATIRVALRLWIDTPGYAMPEHVQVVAAAGDAPLQDADAERLLALLTSSAVRLQLAVEDRPTVVAAALCTCFHRTLGGPLVADIDCPLHGGAPRLTLDRSAG